MTVYSHVVASMFIATIRKKIQQAKFIDKAKDRIVNVRGMARMKGVYKQKKKMDRRSG